VLLDLFKQHWLYHKKYVHTMISIKICFHQNMYIHEDRRRFEHERQRLAQALERNNQLTRTIAAIIPEFAAGE
jgi:hypothetical protein